MSDLTRARCYLLEVVQPPGWTWTTPTRAGVVDDQARGDEPESLPVEVKVSSVELGPVLEMAAERLANIIAESLDGRRPLGQLEMWFDSASLKLIRERHQRLRGMKVRLASMRVQATSEHSAEVALHLSTSVRDHAAACRVTRSGQGWRCSDLVMP
ncbi:MAG: Rv3235 family protein [Propionibacteriaceae bacterium]|nr:Rv3235 family protein [Propionibacteriaceae bacterium]